MNSSITLTDPIAKALLSFLAGRRTQDASSFDVVALITETPVHGIPRQLGLEVINEVAPGEWVGLEPIRRLDGEVVELEIRVSPS